MHPADETNTRDLAALASAAQRNIGQPIEDPARAAKIEELKAKYKSGELTVNAADVAAKLVDSHLKETSGPKARKMFG